MHTPQQPLKSGFTPYTTTSDVILGASLVGKVAIVTGGYAALGLETARNLASAGARVIVPARDTARAETALRGAGCAIEVQRMDLTDAESISAFASRFLSSGLPIHILVNSAGIMASPVLERDDRRNELQLSTNHLGHFKLAALLWPALRRASGARVVSVSSLGHRIAGFDFEDPNFLVRPYDPWVAYGQSKTANILFARELDKRGEAHGVRAFSLHPGGIVTNLAKHMSRDALKAAGNIDESGEPVIDPLNDMKSVPQGAATQLWCAVSPSLNGKGGVFCANCDISPLYDNTSPGGQEEGRYSGVMPYAIDPAAAERLWILSEKMTDTPFPASDA